MNVSVKIASNGRIVIPAAIRHQLGLHGGESLIVRAESGAIVLEPSNFAVERLRSMIRQNVPDNISLADELIADRRAAFHYE